MLCPECPAITVVETPMPPPAVALVHPLSARTPWELLQQQEKDPTLQILPCENH